MALSPYAQRLDMLERQVQGLPVCAGFMLEQPKIERLNREFREVDQKTTRVWIRTHKLEIERLERQVQEHYENRRLTGPGYIYGVPLPETSNLVERVAQRSIRWMVQSKLDMFERLSVSPLFLQGLEEGSDGDELIDELEELGYEEAKNIVSTMDRYLAKVYHSQNIKDSDTFNKRFALYCQLWTHCARENFSQYLKICQERDMALLEYVSPLDPGAFREVVTDFYDVLREDPKVFDGEFLAKCLERQFVWEAWIAQDLALAGHDVLMKLMDEELNEEEVDEWEIADIIVDEMLLNLLEAASEEASEAEGVCDLYVRHRVIFEEVAVLRIKASLGSVVTIFSSGSVSRKKLIGPHRMIFDVLKVLDPDSDRRFEVNRLISFYIRGFNHPLESMDPASALRAVRAEYQGQMAELCAALG